ncbi:MAG: LytTR family DNA-binding domain-containing protein [Pseudomonadota bacterium]
MANLAQLLTHPLGRATAILAAVALFFGTVSPYDAVTYLPLWARASYWFMLIVAGVAVQWAAARALRERIRPTWARFTVETLLSTPLPFLLILGTQQLIGRPVPPDFHARLVAYTWVIVTALWALRPLPFSRPGNASPEAPVAPSDGEADAVRAFRARLPLEHREAELYAVSAEDHYVRVHTAVGTTMILQRLSDAEQLLATLDGVRVHRSWWVARAGVASVTRASGKLDLRLKSGASVPVSRAGAARVREHGWL